MPSNTPTRGFKPGAARAAKMDAWAKERGIASQSEAMKQLIDLGLGVNSQPPPVTTKAAGAKNLSRWNLKGVHFGPVDEPAGSRLKGAHKAPSRGK